MDTLYDEDMLYNWSEMTTLDMLRRRHNIGDMSMTTVESLNQIFRMVFDDDTIRITPDMTANDVDGWDSLSHVNLITAIETKFDIRFTQKDLLKQRKVGDLLADIERKLTA